MPELIPFPQDDRMHYVREAEFLSQFETYSDRNSYVTHYQFMSESRIPGPLTLFGGNIHIQLVGDNPYLKGTHIYRLLIRHMRPWLMPRHDRLINQDGYYSEEFSQGEILDLLTLFLKARFYLTSSGYDDTGTFHPHEFVYFPCSKSRAPFLFEVGKAFHLTEDSFNLINSLPERYHQAFYFAVHSFSKALKMAGIEPDLAYLNLVNSVEALIKFVSLDDTFTAEEEDIKNEIRSGSFSVEVRDELLNYTRQRKVQERFLKFIRHYSTGTSLVKRHTKSEHLYVSLTTFDRHLKEIYKSRSLYVHRGDSFRISEDWPKQDWHLDAVMGEIHDRRHIEGSRLPRFFWFALIVRECLMNFLREKAEER